MLELSFSNIILGIFVFFYGVLIISTGIWIRSKIFHRNQKWRVLFVKTLIGGIIFCVFFVVLEIIDNLR